MNKKFGKYTLLDKIAQGGMAEVWLAKQGGLEGFQKLVVIKKILSEFTRNKNFIKMFLDEARLAAMLNHPNVVQVYDLGSFEGSYFIAMEYIYGMALDKIFKDSIKLGKPLPMQYSCMIISQAAAGLYHAHTKKDIFGQPMNLVHRDISPQNIMVSFEGITKIVDFGIAKAATRSTEETQAGKIKGKVSYMSPEQVRGQELDGRSDVFALGVVLYEITTGRKIFTETNTLKLLENIIYERIIPPSKIIPKFPKPLSAIIMKALSKDRDKRYKSAISLSKDLERFLKMFSNSSSSHELSVWMQKVFKKEIYETRIRYELLIREEESFIHEAPEVVEEATQIFNLNAHKELFSRDNEDDDWEDDEPTQDFEDNSDDDWEDDNWGDNWDTPKKSSNVKKSNKNNLKKSGSRKTGSRRKSDSNKSNKNISSNSRKSSSRKTGSRKKSDSNKSNQNVSREKSSRKTGSRKKSPVRTNSSQRRIPSKQKKKKKSFLGYILKKIILLAILYSVGISGYIGYHYMAATEELDSIVRVAAQQTDPKLNLTTDLKRFCKKDKFIRVCNSQKVDIKPRNAIKLSVTFTLKTKILTKWPIEMQFTKISKTKNYQERRR